MSTTPNSFPETFKSKSGGSICNSHVSGKLSANQLRTFSLHFIPGLLPPLPVLLLLGQEFVVRHCYWESIESQNNEALR
ncbi:hypothetical protein ANTQUA_LOCUS9164 [Anthophora quadrimaculata]